MQIDLFIGVPENDAVQVATLHHFTLRVMRRDGITVIHKKDKDLRRISIELENHLVTKAWVG